MSEIKILIVEDNTTISKNLKRYLELKNFIAEIADSAEIADKILDNENFNLILLDIGLPWKNGKDFLEYLRKKWNNTPIIFLTSRDSDEDMIEGLELWADDYIPKPFDYEIVIARINSVLRRYKKEISATKIWEYLINFDDFQLSRNTDIYVWYLRKKLWKDIIKTKKWSGYYVD